MKPFITVVMPVRNEARFIRETLMQLLSQDYPRDRFEIIVADGMSDDETAEIVKRMAETTPQIRLHRNPRRLSSAGRNIGFREGKGDYFLVVDGHCFIPDDQLFTHIVECFSKSGADCLGRPQPLDPPGLTTFQKAVALARASWLGHGGGSLIYGDHEGFCSPVSHGAIYARHVFDVVGYVDEAFDAAEDVEFNYRVEKAGLTCYSSPKLTIRYYPRETLRALMRQMIRYGRGRRRFTRKHPEALTLNQLIPAFFVTGLFCLALTLLIALFNGILLPSLLLAIPYGLYLLLLIGTAVTIAVKSGFRCTAPVPAIIFVIHFGLGWGFISQAMRLEGAPKL